MTSSDGVALALTLVLALGAPRALAQGQAPTAQELETARTLYKEGKALRARGDLRGALEKLRAAHALGNTPVTGIELARTYVALGKLVDAREVCLRIARTAVATDETEKSAEARVDAASLAEGLKGRIATAVIEIAGVAPDESAHLTIDGVAVPDVAETQQQRLDPGVHEIVARAGEGAAARELRSVVRLAEGQTEKVTLAFPPPGEAPPSPSTTLDAGQPEPAEPAAAKTSWFVPVGVAVGLTGIAVGSLAGVVAMRNRDRLDAECNAQKQCDSHGGGAGDLQTARDWAGVSTASFIAAGVGAVLAIVGIVKAKADPPSAPAVSVWFGSGSAGLHGRF
ncbi:MAG TPA: hypothetical protein VKU41_10850 [Polyangiaceae bacterium]|nr:hypothetical protein [Polyangiaceae bacterium]